MRFERTFVLIYAVFLTHFLQPYYVANPEKNDARTRRSSPGLSFVQLPSYKSKQMPNLKTNNVKSCSLSTTSHDIEPTPVGFIGCGTIAFSIAKGLASGRANISSITVTKRSESKSDSLKKEFPELISIENDGQKVLDQSKFIFLCVLPEQTHAVLRNLKFDPSRHILISLVATTSREDIIRWSLLPSNKVYKMICLPAVAYHEGTCLITPPCENGTLKLLLNSLDGYIDCVDENILQALMVPNCLMGPFYGILRKNRDWLIRQGVSAEDATFFLEKQYSSMLKDVERKFGRSKYAFDKLIEEQTPGGLNEQALQNMEKLDILDKYDDVMDAILLRLQGKSNGEVST